MLKAARGGDHRKHKKMLTVKRRRSSAGSRTLEAFGGSCCRSTLIAGRRPCCKPRASRLSEVSSVHTPLVSYSSVGRVRYGGLASAGFFPLKFCSVLTFGRSCPTTRGSGHSRLARPGLQHGSRSWPAYADLCSPSHAIHCHHTHRPRPPVHRQSYRHRQGHRQRSTRKQLFG